jgi:hypothetical protein
MPANKLAREIDSLRDVIKREWRDVDLLSLSQSDRQILRERVRECAGELWELMKRLDEARHA